MQFWRRQEISSMIYPLFKVGSVGRFRGDWTSLLSVSWLGGRTYSSFEISTFSLGHGLACTSGGAINGKSCILSSTCYVSTPTFGPGDSSVSEAVMDWHNFIPSPQRWRFPSFHKTLRLCALLKFAFVFYNLFYIFHVLRDVFGPSPFESHSLLSPHRPGFRRLHWALESSALLKDHGLCCLFFCHLDLRDFVPLTRSLRRLHFRRVHELNKIFYCLIILQTLLSLWAPHFTDVYSSERVLDEVEFSAINSTSKFSSVWESLITGNICPSEQILDEGDSSAVNSTSEPSWRSSSLEYICYSERGMGEVECSVVSSSSRVSSRSRSPEDESSSARVMDDVALSAVNPISNLSQNEPERSRLSHCDCHLNLNYFVSLPKSWSRLFFWRGHYLNGSSFISTFDLPSALRDCIIWSSVRSFPLSGIGYNLR